MDGVVKVETVSAFMPDEVGIQCRNSHEFEFDGMDIAGIIRQVLPKLDEDSVIGVEKDIQESGPSELSDLKYLKEDDLKDNLKPLMKRRLLDHFRCKYDEGCLPAMPLSVLLQRSRPQSPVARDQQLCGGPASPAEDREMVHQQQQGYTSNGHNQYDFIFGHDHMLDSDASGMLHLPNQNSRSPVPQCSSSVAEADFLNVLRHSTAEMEPSPAQLSFNTSITSRIDAIYKLMKEQNRIINCKLDRLLRIQQQQLTLARPEYAKLPFERECIQAPAGTLDELDDLLNAPGLDRLLAEQVGNTPVESTRLIIRRLFSKKLACQFSLTGLGEKRARIKYSFKGHKICDRVVDAIQFMHPGTTRSEVIECIRRQLKSAPDWEGGRPHRLRSRDIAVEQAQQQRQKIEQQQEQIQQLQLQIQERQL